MVITRDVAVQTVSRGYRPAAVAEHLIASQVVAQVFRIRVLQPVRRADNSERFPVLYVTDADSVFDALASLASILQGAGETPRFVVVGIGYENTAAAAVLRWRDFPTHDIRALFHEEIRQINESPLVASLDDLNAVMQATDAREFLHFTRQELMPFVADHYPTLPNDSSYFGYSAGSIFGLYTLFAQPDAFKRYILGSPATSYDGHNFAVELAQHFSNSGRTMDAKVFMSVGELEEFKRGHGPLGLVSGCYLFAKYLRNSPIRNLDLTFRVFPGETHATSWTLAFAHGLRALFGSVDQVPYWPEFLKQGCKP